MNFGYVLRDGRAYRDVPDAARFLTAGVDVQARELYYTVRAWGPQQTSWQIESGMLNGDTLQEAVWDDLADVLLSDFGGRRIRLALVDSGYRPDRAIAFARKYPNLVKPSKGVAQSRTYRTKPCWLTVASLFDMRVSVSDWKHL